MGIKIINDVFDNSEMKGNDRLVMISIADNANNENRQAWPSVREISRKTRIPIRTVWRCVKRCVASGELKIVKSGGHEGESNLYEVLVRRSSPQPTDTLTGVPNKGEAMPSTGIPPMPMSGTLTVSEPSTQPSGRGSRFAPPTQQEVIDHGQKMSPKLLEQECKKFHSYYESNGWMVGRNKMRSWTAAMVNWRERNYGNTRGNTQENPRNIGVCKGVTDYGAASKRKLERQQQETLALQMDEDANKPQAAQRT